MDRQKEKQMLVVVDDIQTDRLSGSQKKASWVTDMKTDTETDGQSPKTSI
jgi:hypothetical protein